MLRYFSFFRRTQRTAVWHAQTANQGPIRRALPHGSRPTQLASAVSTHADGPARVGAQRVADARQSGEARTSTVGLGADNRWMHTEWCCSVCRIVMLIVEMRASMSTGNGPIIFQGCRILGPVSTGSMPKIYHYNEFKINAICKVRRFYKGRSRSRLFQMRLRLLPIFCWRFVKS